MDLISCFIPSVVCSWSKPSVLVTHGSQKNLLCFYFLLVFVGDCLDFVSTFCCHCDRRRSESGLVRILVLLPVAVPPSAAALSSAVLLNCLRQCRLLRPVLLMLGPVVVLFGGMTLAMLPSERHVIAGVAMCWLAFRNWKFRCLLCLCLCCGCCLLAAVGVLRRPYNETRRCLCCHRCRVDDVHRLFVVLVWLCLSSDCPCFENLSGDAEDVLICWCVFAEPNGLKEACFHLRPVLCCWHHVENCFTKLRDWCFVLLVPASVVAGVAIWMHWVPAE